LPSGLDLEPDLQGVIGLAKDTDLHGTREIDHDNGCALPGRPFKAHGGSQGVVQAYLPGGRGKAPGCIRHGDGDPVSRLSRMGKCAGEVDVAGGYLLHRWSRTSGKGETDHQGVLSRFEDIDLLHNPSGRGRAIRKLPGGPDRRRRVPDTPCPECGKEKNNDQRNK